MGKLQIMGKEGDVKVEWNPDNKTEVEIAEKQFNDLKKKGFSAFRMYDGGKKGRALDSFDKFAEKILFVPPMAGG
jgi:hypothetical protein